MEVSLNDYEKQCKKNAIRTRQLPQNPQPGQLETVFLCRAYQPGRIADASFQHHQRYGLDNDIQWQVSCKAGFDTNGILIANRLEQQIMLKFRHDY
jgi:hypothetical protein